MTLRDKTILLYQAQGLENGGRGVSCVREIVNYLERGDLRSAKTVANTDSDKIRNYPFLSLMIQAIFETEKIPNKEN
jgi:hypothetical protein